MSSASDLISFDYAIKYLLRDKRNFDIIESFLSALLGAYGYASVKIVALLESESNREESATKRSLADLIVQDQSGTQYIVEIDRGYTDVFLEKACFNTSRLIVDSLFKNDDYSSIQKVFHVNLLYFKYQDMKSPIYHGKTWFHEVETGKAISMELLDQNRHHLATSHVFPEYFIISVPMFDDVVEKELDEWLYVMKNARVPQSARSPVMEQVEKRLSLTMMNDAELQEYSQYRSQFLKQRDYVASALRRGMVKGDKKGLKRGRAEGMRLGKELGKQQGLHDVARSMFEEGESLDKIARITRLSHETLLLIRANVTETEK